MTARPQPITRAYRADLSERRTPFGIADDAWLAVGSLLEHAASVAPVDAAAAAAMVADACEQATRAVAPARIQALRAREWSGRGSAAVDAVMLLSDSAQEATALHVAASLLDATLAAQPDLAPLTRGRILARRARVTWKMGWLAEAYDACSDLLEMGQRDHEPELVGRAWVGFATIAQMRGNYPEMERCAGELERAASAIRHDYLLRIARTSQMIVAGVRKEFGRALAHAWTVYGLSNGDPLEEAETLQNIGQLLLDAGYPDAARAAFAHVVSHAQPARFLLPALGGLALASAQSRHDATVLWATSQVAAFDDTAPRWPLAYALMECASACDAVGHPAKAEAARTRASELAEAFNFHEIAYRAAERRDQSPLDVPATTVAREIVALEPDRLPDRVELLAAV
jgi:tetratricopeptide (TPR) repeat protein